MNDGDVVQLKSGGSPMTILGKDELGEFICVWHERKKDGTTIPFRESYPEVVLRLYQRAPALVVGSMRRRGF